MAVTKYVWNPFTDNVLMEKDDADNVTASYTTEPDQFGNLISQDRGGTASYYHYDGQGSTLALTDSSGDVTDTFEYDAFGNVTKRTGNTEVPFQFGGQEGYYTDKELPYIYVRRRSYEPTIARWTSVDPLGMIGELSTPDMREHPYVYARNNPVNNVDPSGLNPFLACLFAVARGVCNVCVPPLAAIAQVEVDARGVDVNDWARGGRAFLHCFAVCRTMGSCGSICITWWDAREQGGSVADAMGLSNNREGRECRGDVDVSGGNCWRCCMSSWAAGELSCQVGAPPYRLEKCPGPPADLLLRLPAHLLPLD